MTTVRQLLEMKVEIVENDFSYLKGYHYDFVPEVGDVGAGFLDFVSTTSPKVEIRIIKHVDFDYRRFWRLAVVVFDGVNVMITQNAGREGDDHAHRFILDENAYRALLGYLTSMPRKPKEPEPMVDSKTTVVTDLDHDYVNELTYFYNDKLEHVAPRRY